MKLLVVGDSFTYGEELGDLNHSWPNILSSQFQCELINLSKPGSGNTGLIRHCMEQVDNYNTVIIAWSHYARMEFADAWGIYDIWPGCRDVLFTDDVKHRKELIKYINRYHIDAYFYKQYLINIILLQNYLKLNRKKYIMLDSFGNHQSKERKINTNLTNQIDIKYFLGWPNESMMEWTYGCPQGPGGHFLEEGHRRVADKINEHIRHLGWVS
jgi:lysophospholipase L1-like esterase